jgi:hypothetical protein
MLNNRTLSAGLCNPVFFPFLNLQNKDNDHRQRIQGGMLWLHWCFHQRPISGMVAHLHLKKEADHKFGQPLETDLATAF